MDYIEFTKNIPSPASAPVILLRGKESFLRGDVINKLSEEHNLETRKFDGDNVEPSRLEETLRTRSLHQVQKLVRVSDLNASFLKNHYEWLKTYLDHPAKDQILLIESPSPRKNLKSVKLLQKEALLIECNRPEEKTLRKWITRFFQKEDKRIEPAAVEELLKRTDSDLQIIKNEIDKLLMYCRDRDTARKEDVQQCVSDSGELEFLDFTDAWLNGEYEEVLREIRRQLAEGESEMKISGGLLWAFRRLRLMVELYKMGMDVSDISKEAGTGNWVVKQYLKKRGGAESTDFQQAAETFLKKDILSREGLISPEFGLEMLVLDGLRECSLYEEEHPISLKQN